MSATPISLPRFDPSAVVRAVLAGSAWGLLLTAGFAALAVYRCGTMCLNEVALTAATSMAAGILTIGPLAAFARRS